ncbi:MAG: sugar phosphate isomerase/epimerase [Acidobacteria bacterium]|nr:sugar phosphate isomerase/epimerase [Acidobacteriota bacterium]
MNNSQQKLNRREFMQLGAAITLLPSPLLAAAKWKKIPIATQAWCVRKQMKDDIPGTLAAVAQLGYQGIELENAFGKTGPEWRKFLDAAKLKPCGFHHSLGELRGDKLKASIEFNQAIGNRNLIIRSLPREVYTSKELLAAEVNEIADKLKPAGLRIGYHNHTTDFNKFGEDYWWNLFADQTRKNVILQFDTGNASEMQGVTVTDFLKRNKGRTISMHVKPYSKKSPDAYLGDDELDWKQIMTIVESIGGLEWYIIEYERDVAPPLESLKANLDRFKKMRR